jgi:hypothetical protein
MSAVNAKYLAPLRAKLARSDDLVQRALAAVLVAEAAAGIDGICARLSQLRGEFDALCRQRETCLLRVDAQARKRAKRAREPLGVCNPECWDTGLAEAPFETRFVMGIAQLEEEYHMLCAREAYLREHCSDVKKAHKALLHARRGLHSVQEALAQALHC